MDLGPLLTLGAIYAVLSLIGRIGKGGKQPGASAPSGDGSPTPARTRVPGKPETLEDLLAEMRGELERAREVEVEPPPPPTGSDRTPVAGPCGRSEDGQFR